MADINNINSREDLIEVINDYVKTPKIPALTGAQLNILMNKMVEYVPTEIQNSLDFSSPGRVLDARQGKALKDLIDGVTTGISNITPSETPEPNISIYNLSIAATYPNLDNIEVTIEDLNSGVVQARLIGGVWTKNIIGIPLQAYASKTEIGVDIYSAGINFIPDLTGTDFDNTDVWGVGFLRSNGAVTEQIEWRYTKKFYPVVPGSYTSNIYVEGNAKILIYDIDLNITQVLSNKGTTTGSGVYSVDISSNEKYIRTSKPAFLEGTDSYLKLSATTEVVSSKVFATPGYVETVKETLNRDIYLRPSKNEIGILTIFEGVNIALPLMITSFADTTEWGIGFLRNTGVVTTDANWYYTKKFSDILPGTYNSNIYVAGNAKGLIYDKNYNVIQVLSDVGNIAGTAIHTITVVENARYFRTSKSVSQLNVKTYVESTSNREQAEPIVFAPPSFVTENITASKAIITTERDLKLKDYGLQTILANTNMLSELAASLLTDVSIWEPGYLNSAGGVSISTGWQHCKKYYTVYPGTYNMRGYFTGNAKAQLYDDLFNPILPAITNPATGTDLYQQEITFTSKAYLRMSFRGAQALVPNIYLKPTTDLFINDLKIDISSVVSQGNIGKAVNGFGIASKMKDNFKEQFPARRKPPVITFIADDGGHASLTPHTDPDWYLAMLDEFNVRGTFAIISGRIDTNPDFWGRQDILDAIAKGHDIAGHTVSHNNGAQLATLTEDQLEYEIGYNKLSLISIDDRLKAKMFVSPFGSRNPLVDKVVRRYYDANFVSIADAQITANTCTNIPPITTFNLKRVSFDHGATGWEGISRIAITKQAVDVANAVGGWLVFAVHPHFGEYLQPNTVDRRAELHELLTYIKSLNIPIMTASQAISFYGNVTEIGYSTVTSKYYSLGMDGSETGNYFD